VILTGSPWLTGLAQKDHFKVLLSILPTAKVGFPEGKPIFFYPTLGVVFQSSLCMEFQELFYQKMIFLLSFVSFFIYFPIILSSFSKEDRREKAND
jgi:hypothetical protein